MEFQTEILAYDERASAETVMKAIARSGAALVRHFPIGPEPTELLRFANQLGEISAHGIGTTSNTEGTLIHRIESLTEPRRDRFGNIVLSTTSEAVPCHTDDYFNADPADTVVLLCQQSGVGGESLICHLQRLLIALGPDVELVLRKPIFPTPYGYAPVVEGTGARAKIRFNSYEIRKYVSGGAAIPAEADSLVAKVDATAERYCETVLLCPGDCLVLDNRRVLHGRTGFDSNSKRLLWRVRLNREACRGGLQ